MQVGVVVLNYKNYKETINCVESILLQKDVEFKIVIVENGSPNESAMVLKEKYNDYDNIKIICSDSNLGYAKGNNLGIKYLLEQNIKNILISNSDIVLSTDDILKQLVSEYEENVGLLVPLIKNLDGSIEQRVVYKKKLLYLRILKKIIQVNFNIKDVNKKKTNSYVEKNKEIIGINTSEYVVSGSAFMLTQDFFKYYNGLFEKTFLYFEEWATIILLHKAKLQSKVINTNVLIHKGGQSSYRGDNAEKIKLGYMKDSSKKILSLMLTGIKFSKKE